MLPVARGGFPGLAKPCVDSADSGNMILQYINNPDPEQFESFLLFSFLDPSAIN